MQGETERDWTNIFNSRYGSGITRRNVAIGIPIVQNLTFPLDLYQDGTVNPPSVVSRKIQSRGIEEYLEDSAPRRGDDSFASIDSNPNYRGPGTYEQKEHKHGLYFELPEFGTYASRLSAPGVSRRFPIEVRRQIFN